MHYADESPRTKNTNLIRRIVAKLASRAMIRFMFKGDDQPCGAIAEMVRMAAYPGTPENVNRVDGDVGDPSGSGVAGHAGDGEPALQ